MKWSQHNGSVRVLRGRRSQLQFLTFQAGLEKLRLACSGSLTHWMRWTDGLIV